MQTELRVQDNISEFSELVLKPAVNYHLNEHWAFSLGYKYIDKDDDSNEQEPWQEVHYNWKCRDLVGGLQLRFEQRFISGTSGILPRLRLLGHLSHPIADSVWYTTAWSAVRFNAGDKPGPNGDGPVSGFEQSRIFVGLGRHIGKHTKFEFGYLYRYERKRSSDDLSDHAIHLRVVFNTGTLGKHPSNRDQYR